MSQTGAAPLEPRRWPKVRSRYVGAVRAQAAQALACAGHSEHLLCVLLPIGGESQHPAGPQLIREQPDETLIDQAALVVALLVPRIREKHQYFIEASIRERAVHDLDGVAANHAQVGELGLLGAQQEPPDAGPMGC